MAEVVYLEPDQSPPEGQDWALVVRNPEGGNSGSGSVVHGRGATFYVPFPDNEPDQAIAIARAKEWADKNGVPVVYVVRR
jgi:hypothetical protein